MTDINKLRLVAFQKVYEDEKLCCKDVKKQVLRYMKEADEHDVKAYLLDGDLDIVEEDAKPIVDERFEKSEIKEDIELLGEEYLQEMDPVSFLGLMAGGIIAAGVAKDIAAKFSKCYGRCRRIEETDKRRLCKLKCKLEGREAKLKKLKQYDCSEKDDPKKCKEKVKKQIEKEEKRIGKLKEQIKGLES